MTRLRLWLRTCSQMGRTSPYPHVHFSERGVASVDVKQLLSQPHVQAEFARAARIVEASRSDPRRRDGR